MSSGPNLDGAGHAKMETLEEATGQVQRIHGIVERMAIAVRSQQNTAQFGLQIRRAGSPLVGLLKGQFGMISDQVSAMMLIATRGGGDQAKLRSLREAVAQLRIQLEIAIAKTKEKHTLAEETDEP
jgi:predicted RND superfamily exporter protein